MKILLIEDEKKISILVSKVLKDSGYKVTVCKSMKEVLKNGLEYNHDLIILDLLLNNERGEDLVIDLRKRSMNIPILVLSCLTEAEIKVDLLKMGVDDYLTKPFDFDELLARIEALRRRCLDISFNDEETCGDITFYWKQNKISREKKEIHLTRKQGELLHLLVENRGKTVKTDEILKRIWGVELGSHSNVVQSTMRRLRKQVDNGFSHKLIRNIHGIGYCIELPSSKTS